MNLAAILCLGILVGFAGQSVGMELVESAGAELVKEITCTGKVVDSEGQGLAGAQVKLYQFKYYVGANSYDTESVEEKTTGADGTFSFSISVDASEYRYRTGTIVAQKEGLAIGWADWRMREDQDVDKIELGQAKELAGMVVDEKGEPVAQAKVSIYQIMIRQGDNRRYLGYKAASGLLTVDTDAAGKFLFTNLPVGVTVEFLVTKAGRAAVCTYEPVSYRREKMQFAPGQADIKIVMPIEAKIEGMVVEKGTGKAVSNVVLMVLCGEDQQVYGQKPLSSKEDGTFGFDSLNAGKHILHLVPPLTQREGPADWVGGPVEVTVEVGETKSGVKFEVSKGGLLEVLFTESVNKKLLEETIVSVQDKAGGPWFYERSDKDGVAEIRLLPGEYQISRVYKEGYFRDRQEEAVTIEENKTVRLDVQMSPMPTVTGVLRDEAGKPVEGASVEICPSGRGTGSSDAQGKFEVKWDPSSLDRKETTHCLVVRHQERNLAKIEVIEKDIKTVDVKLIPAVVFTGKVVDTEGKGISGVKITVTLQMSPWDLSITDSRQGTVVTDAKGKFEIKAIPPGHEYKLNARIEGYGQDELKVLADDAVNNRLDVGQLTLARANLLITGMAVEKGTGKPAEGARLWVTRVPKKPNSGQVSTAVSKKDGTFTIGDLEAGKYILKLDPPRKGPANWLAEPMEVTAEAGKTKNGVKYEVSKGGLLEVLVTESVNKKPIEKADVNVRDQARDQWFSGRSDKDGVAKIRLLPGEYQMSGIYKEGYARNEQKEAITIEENKTFRLEIQLPRIPIITGVVSDEAGKPVEEVAVKICPIGRGTESSDAQGKFEAKWDPASWSNSEIPLVLLVAQCVERNLVAAVEIEENTRTVDVKLVPAVVFTGKVVDPKGKGIPDIRISVKLWASGWGSTINGRGQPVTDGEGKFELRAIPPGYKYSISARAEGYGKNTMNDILANDAVDNRLDVGQLILAVADQSVSGRVVDDEGNPVENVNVDCYGDNQPGRPSVKTDKDGKFMIEKLCPGEIRVSANLSVDQKRLYRSVRTEGGVTDLEIVVAEKGSGSRRFVPKQPPSLVGKALPDLKAVNVALNPNDIKDKLLLVCFWDMQQRPSRHCVKNLAEMAEALAAKGVTTISVQASKVDEKDLKYWIEKLNIGFPVGVIEGDEEKTKFAWGVRALPWLILTDRNHVVGSNGFSLIELDEKLKTINGD